MGLQTWLRALSAGIFQLVLLACCAAGPAVALTPADPHRILVLHSYHKGLGWTDSISEGIEEYFRSQGLKVDLHYEYMDTKRFHDEAHLENLFRLLRYKYRAEDFDAIISSDDHAFRFLLAHRPELVPEAPLVFCGVNRFSPEMIANQAGVTGVVESIDIAATLDGILRVEPSVTTVYALADHSLTGRANKRLLQEVMPRYGERLQFRFIEDQTMEQIQEMVRRLPPDAVLLLLAYTRDGAGKTYSLEESSECIARYSSRPLYSLWDFHLDHGMLGGMLTSGRAHGEKAAELVARILAGSDAGSLPVVADSPNRYIFDYREMVRFGIDSGRLPPGSTVRNKPVSFYEEYRLIVRQVLAGFLFLIVLLLYAGFNLFKRRAAERSLKQSETRLRAIFNAASNVGFVLVDAVGPVPRVIGFSRGAEKMFGYSEEEMLGRPVGVLHLEQDVAGFPEMHKAMREGGQGVSREMTLVRKSGDCFAALFSAHALFDEAGRMWAALGVSIDISAQKKVEQALRESEERFREMAYMLPEAIYELDLEGRITFVNQSGLDKFQYTAQDVEHGLNVRQLFSAEEYQRLQGNIAAILTGKPGGLNEYVARKKDGTELPVYARSSVIIREGKPSGIRGFLIDISEKKQLEDQFHRAQRLEALGTLAGGIAHDFNNLLMGIQGRASLAREDLERGHPARTHLEDIEQYVSSASGLTRQLLGYARAGKYDPKATDINTMLLRTVEMFGRTRKELEIRTLLADKAWTVNVDQGQVEQVILNLLVNAWQAMERSGRITVETANQVVDEARAKVLEVQAGRFVRVGVSDSGIGMDQATMNRIFEPFFSTKDKGRGTGLGLASAYGIIKNHHGNIHAHSAPGKGTTFHIYLPAVETEPEAVSETNGHLVKGDATVMLVDDEAMILEVGRALLERLGYSVVSFGSGRDAIDYFRKQHARIDLVILDMVMPGMDGGQVQERLRAIDPDVRILLSSGYSRDGMAEAILAAGNVGFIQKPFNLGLLSLKIKEQLK